MKEFKFNDAAQALIYQMYHQDNPDITNQSSYASRCKIFLKLILQISKSSKLLNADFQWQTPINTLDLGNYNDLNLLIIYNSLKTSYNVLWGQQENDLVNFGLLKIWIKILQSDTRINADLANALSDTYDFQPNPNDMMQHMEAVEKEISINYFANELFAKNNSGN
jgi:hypothetical protein